MNASLRRIARQISSMSSIHIRHPHSLTPAKARKAVEDVAKTLSERFDFEYRWEDDVMHFSRSGVDGLIELSPKQLTVQAKLGFLLAMMKQPIEEQIRKVLDERFS